MLTARLALAVAVVPLALSAGGCGGNDEDATTTGSIPRLAPCAKAGPSIGRPDTLPEDFPLPPGTRLTLEQEPSAGQVVIRGFSPGEVDQAAAFFKGKLPDAGYDLGRGDAEKDEAEAVFEGNGYRGGWRVNRIVGCPAVRLLLVFVQQS
jgi:hypothetical protein